MLSRYTHLSPIHRWKAVEDLTQVGTVTEKGASSKKTQKLLEGVVSRLGLEPGPSPSKIDKMGFYSGLILRRFPRLFFANKDLR